VPTSGGGPIELAQGIKVPEVRYLNKHIGTTNKWSVKQSLKNLYFIDTVNKDIVSFGENLLNMSNELGMKSWSDNLFESKSEFSLKLNADAFIVNYDSIDNNLYITSNKESLSFSERLMQFESFFSYEDTEFGFNYNNEYVMTNTEGFSTKL
jgi:hypothetical protein